MKYSRSKITNLESMVDKDNVKRKHYHYPVSLFGPRSLTDHDISIHNVSNFKVYQAFVPTWNLTTYKYALSSSARPRFERQADLAGTASGYGDYYCPEGIPVETALFCLLGAFGLAFGILFRAITLKTGGRRKRRSTGESTPHNSPNSFSFFYQLNDLAWSGRLL